MDQSASPTPSSLDPRAADRRSRVLPLAVAVALGLGLLHRLLVGWDAPLWLDETFTAAIAMQPTFAGLIYDCLHELGGPVYYGFMWAWEKLAGPGDVAMRLPSLLFAIAAPLVMLRWGHPDRATRLTLAALAALWVPGAYYASEARSYSLLFLGGTIQLICFGQMMRAPTRAAALRWCIVSALLILTHYHAAVLGGLQGLAFLAVHRVRALRCWPAALVFVPMGAWMALHLPLHIRFSNPDVSWQSLLTFRDLLGLPQLLLGLGKASYLLVPIVAVTLAVDLWATRRRIAFPFDRIDIIAVALSLAAVAIVFGAGFIQPSFTSRYLIPFVPGVLLGLALWAVRWSGRWRYAPLLLIALFALMFTRDLQVKLAKDVDFRRGYSWDPASAWLRERGVRHTVFLWDNSNAVIMDPWQLGRVGAFFLHRAGEPVTGRAVKAIGTDAEIRAALARAASTPESLSKVTGTITLARFDRKLQLSQDDPRYTCRDFGGPPFGSDVYATACYRQPIRPRPAG